MQAIAGGDVRRMVGTSATPINNLMHWFQAISANMSSEAQRKALGASRRAASSVFTDAGDDEISSVAVKTTQSFGDLEKVEYSTEVVAVGFTP